MDVYHNNIFPLALKSECFSLKREIFPTLSKITVGNRSYLHGELEEDKAHWFSLKNFDEHIQMLVGLIDR